MEKEIFFSIIIPHKNIPDLLNRCVSTIPERDDLEIIIVDDNSSADIVDFRNFPCQDRLNCRIIYDKKGSYAGHARNLALDVARGKWILFADSDDMFNYCINDILDDYKKDDSDVIFFKALSIDSYYYTSSYRSGDRLNNYIENFNENVERYTNLLKYKCGEPWAKMIKKRLIDKHHIRFDEIVIHNDHKFSYLLGYYSQSIRVDKRALYCVTTRRGSVRTNVNKEAFLTRIRVFGEAELFFKSKNLPSYVIWDQHFYQLGSLYYNDNELYKTGAEILESLGFQQKEIKRRAYLYSYKSYIGCIYKSILRKLLCFLGVYTYDIW